MINSPSGSSGWRKELAARTKKKKKLKYTLLMLYPQIHAKSKGLLMSKLDLNIFRIWSWRILLWAINQICFASATLVGIYTCMNRGPDLPPGYSRETSWDCAHSPIPIPIFPQKDDRAAFISEGWARYQWWNFLSTIKCLVQLLQKALSAFNAAGSDLPLQKASHTKEYRLKGFPFLHALSKVPLGFK